VQKYEHVTYCREFRTLSVPFPITGTARLCTGKGHLSFGDKKLFPFVLGSSSRQSISLEITAVCHRANKPKGENISVRAGSQETGLRRVSASPQNWQYAAAGIMFQALYCFLL